MTPWRNAWHNFRGFGRLQGFEFPRLTILIGRNNVGKTSAYAPLLLLRQTLDATNRETSLLTRGPLIDVGSFKDVVFQHDTDRVISFHVGVDVTTTTHEPRQRLDISRLEVSFSMSEDGRPVLTRSRVIDEAGKPLITRTRESDSLFNVTSSLVPSRLSVGRPLREVTELRTSMRQEQPLGFFFHGYESMRLPASFREDQERWNKARVWYNAAFNMQDVYRVTNWQVMEQLRSISYLGPLRSLPQRTYRLSGERPVDVGRDGEHAPEVLFLSADTETLDRVNDWLGRLGYGTLHFQDLGDDFFQVHLKMHSRSDLHVNLAHCGVGLSQLLPLLVQGSQRRPGTTFIAQQPEIHLNPAQQCLVADFLLEATEGSHQRVVVETHSEHIFLRIRRRIAEGQIKASDVAVYFFDYRNGSTHVEQIEIGPAGEISRDQWPEGFFEEQLSDALELARAQSRRAGELST